MSPDSTNTDLTILYPSPASAQEPVPMTSATSEIEAISTEAGRASQPVNSVEHLLASLPSRFSKLKITRTSKQQNKRRATISLKSGTSMTKYLKDRRRAQIVRRRIRNKQKAIRARSCELAPMDTSPTTSPSPQTPPISLSDTEDYIIVGIDCYAEVMDAFHDSGGNLDMDIMDTMQVEDD